MWGSELLLFAFWWCNKHHDRKQLKTRMIYFSLCIAVRYQAKPWQGFRPVFLALNRCSCFHPYAVSPVIGKCWWCPDLLCSFPHSMTALAWTGFNGCSVLPWNKQWASFSMEIRGQQPLPIFFQSRKFLPASSFTCMAWGATCGFSCEEFGQERGDMGLTTRLVNTN